MTRRRKVVILALVGLLGLALANRIWINAYLRTPKGGQVKTVLKVDKGSTLKPLLFELASREVLERPGWLYLYARLSGQTKVMAGTYHFSSAQTPLHLLSQLGSGQVRMESFTVIEGRNRWEVRDMLAREGWVEPAAFDALCDDKGFLKSRGVPGPSCEGYLFPDTYTFARGVPARTLLSTLFAAFRRTYAEVTRQGRGPLDLGQRELATLASIVEEETGATQERPRIACVFYNRLRARPPWRLQTDPTVIYAAQLQDPNFQGNLTRAHLRELNSPYNTYLRYGLPPGPIANFGRAALKAVVKPAVCDDFFFVSKNNGEHVFCRTLDCHNRAVQKWQVDYFRRR